MVAAPGVAARMDAQYSPRRFGGFWDLRFPGQISGQHVTAEPLTDGLIELGRLRLAIVDREGLKRRACECYAALDLHDPPLPAPVG